MLETDKLVFSSHNCWEHQYLKRFVPVLCETMTAGCSLLLGIVKWSASALLTCGERNTSWKSECTCNLTEFQSIPKYKVPFKACCCVSMHAHQLIWDHLITSVLLQLLLLKMDEVVCFHLEIVKRRTPVCVKAKEEVLLSLPVKPQIQMSCSQGKGVRLKDTSVGQNRSNLLVLFVF